MSAGVRDVIRFDQRAVGLSEPRLCVSLADSAARDSLSGQAKWNGDAHACIADMKAKGRGSGWILTAVQADDVRELRLALGYDKWDLFGVSYGGRLAVEVMRRDSSAVRAVILHSPAIPAVASLTEDPISFEHALKKVFARCAIQTDCRTAFPALGQDFYEVWMPNQLPLDGSVAGDTLRFSVKSPDRTRTIRFSGALQGDSITFVREVDGEAGSNPGQGIFGVAGARSFTAIRSP
jgi:pimeloyl-ACP methyl ester carboxylesterase